MLNDSLFSSAKVEWGTPQKLFDKLNNEFHFTFDVCADSTNHKCYQYYDEAINGLTQPWTGTIWMNPPYGRGIHEWVAKAFNTSQEGHTCVCLLPVRSDTKWWHNYVMKASEIRLLNKRLTFEGGTNKAPFPAAIVVFSPDNSITFCTGMNVE